MDERVVGHCCTKRLILLRLLICRRGVFGDHVEVLHMRKQKKDGESRPTLGRRRVYHMIPVASNVKHVTLTVSSQRGRVFPE